ncbi:hypothetical protein PGT21_009547 [Puccinia graminis f. sp. tritici]|uniref:Uncharacterized protein n=1 Tax=Puccinia graminis f. sp. tritici TaxID=56615 RepID=A0A5B0Q5E0_PUCGR|nr:hypothetical protein PGT21_009547 [Puccinia graminis f. sp. tritici]
MSLDYIITAEQVAFHIGFEVSRTNLPVVIKQKTCHFAKFLQDGLEEVINFRYLSNGPTKSRSTFREWDTELCEALRQVQVTKAVDTDEIRKEIKVANLAFDLLQDSSFKDEDQQIVKNQYNSSVKEKLASFQLKNRPTKIIPLHHIPSIWKAVKNTTEREFATMYAGNAEILIRCLRFTQRVVKNLAVFDKIYYAMKVSKISERSLLVEEVKNKFEKSKRFELMSSKEIKKLENLLNLIGNNSDNIDYHGWKKRIFQRMSYLPTELVIILGDMFDDCFRTAILEREDDSTGLKTLLLNLKNSEFCDILRQDLLSDELKKEVDGMWEHSADKYIRKKQEEFIISILSNESNDKRWLLR